MSSRFVELGSNQFIFSSGQPLETDLGYMGHCISVSAIPDDGVVEIRTSPSFDGIDVVESTRATIFIGSKKEFLLWQEESNGW